jgi:DNA polymerase III sliding clamp (beta) subunit (PCNA family)
VSREVKADVLHLAGSDLDLTVQVEATVAGLAEGVCVIPARLGTDIVRAVGDQPSSRSAINRTRDHCG